MKRVKKVEIIIDSPHLSKLIDLLDEHGVRGYSVIPDVAGKGERGSRGGDDAIDDFKNSYVMVICGWNQAPALVEAITPMIHRLGGICLVSDAEWIHH